MKKTSRITIFTAMLIIGLTSLTFSQSFSKVTASSNEIETTALDENYSGAAFIDFDNDGDLDLFTSRGFLFRNDGGDSFVLLETGIGESVGGGGNGVSWADYDNDGDLDLYMAGNKSRLYRNDGDETFTLVDVGAVSPQNDTRGWAAAWGDYDEDGFVDLLVVHPAGFVGAPSTPSHLYINLGNDYFVEDFSYEFSQVLAPYTVPTWYDYDLDNDLDLFLASGPVDGIGAPDYLYKNTLTETGTADLIRIDDSPIGTDVQNGQTWNFIDYDNDGDLDAFITNYGAVNNKFYENQNGSFVEIVNSLNFADQNLANVWGDLDNDGDLDVVITGETKVYYFRNDGEEGFTAQSNDFTSNGFSSSAVFGDYDIDGDLDLFISGDTDTRGLFKNENDNGNNWVSYKLTGTATNTAAIGAKIRVLATIDGEPTWQLREITSQNSFNGHSSLSAHFGLGDASVIDSVIIEWPGGNLTEITGVSANDFYEVTEEMPSGYLRTTFKADTLLGFDELNVSFNDLSVTGPGSPITSWEWDFDNDGTTDAVEQNPTWTYTEIDTYSVTLTVSNGVKTITKTIPDYIIVIPEPGMPVLLSYSPTFTDTTLIRRGQIRFEVEAIDTTNYDLSVSWDKNGSFVWNGSAYLYTATSFDPAPREDTIKVNISNGYNMIDRTWYVFVDTLTTGVVTEHGDIPTKYAVYQNYPNPFNPSTNISFDIPRQSFVSLKIYDAIGREVAALINREMNAGRYNVNFDASKLSSGIYFYRIESEGFIKTNKMLLVK
ncbi:MAG: FG-GAP-like repeat-containing protein [Melioribacteraceae bacterium]|nr:FG-GAP-like repeat-containing protein [Melioribacteraceae bacterium]MCF8356782.1 FG-GAP-like repeat-containing protein [Melioribacteraceae bacterium]MCF8396154.1 FG-GAP-like repeat-containing protein [Melioribacteraceae bacterium]MCF8421108.1 FG-GAP-like repeat-containing protein [Melioribacteraceae bacterium]